MSLLWASMLELGVLGILIVILIGSIYVIRLTESLEQGKSRELH